MLSVRGLSKLFGQRVAVDRISFAIASGEIYGLLGPNGAGKTTSISMIAGILARDAGEITIDGISIDAGPPARAMIGIVPQSITLYLDLTARENLDFWGRMYDLSGAALRDAGTAILYTTHYMEEAERLCARIGIIDSGRLIAEGTRAELVARLGQEARIEIGVARGDSLEHAERIVSALEGVVSATVENSHLHVIADRGANRLPTMLSALLNAGTATESVRVVEPNLEDVFLRMTGRALRD